MDQIRILPSVSPLSSAENADLDLRIIANS